MREDSTLAVSIVKTKIFDVQGRRGLCYTVHVYALDGSIFLPLNNILSINDKAEETHPFYSHILCSSLSTEVTKSSPKQVKAKCVHLYMYDVM